MFKTLTNLAKASVAVAVTPLAIIADVVTLPASAESNNRGPFDNTASTIKLAKDAFKLAVRGE